MLFVIEQYETHTQKYEVEADDKAQALSKLFSGQGRAVDNSSELVEVNFDAGMSIESIDDDAAEKIRDVLDAFGHECDSRIPSIRSIEEEH